MRHHERERAVAFLREKLRPGMTVYTVLRSVSASGMSRCLDLYCVYQGEIIRITWSAAQALDGIYDTRKSALRVNGCGMDMGFDAVHSLAQVLFNDTSALRQSWL